MYILNRRLTSFEPPLNERAQKDKEILTTSIITDRQIRSSRFTSKSIPTRQLKIRTSANSKPKYNNAISTHTQISLKLHKVGRLTFWFGRIQSFAKTSSLLKDGLPYLFRSFRNKYFNKISLGNLLYFQNRL